MPKGPALSSRQLPWLLVGLGGMFLALGSLTLLAGIGLLSPEFASTLATEFILVGTGLAYAVAGGILFWKHAGLQPGTKEYDEYHRQKDWHAHVTQGSVAYAVGMGTLFAGLTILMIVEGPQGRCYRYAPHPCLLSISPSAGWEFWGTALLVAGPAELFAFGLWKFVGWYRDRIEDRSVRAWLEGEGPL